MFSTNIYQMVQCYNDSMQDTPAKEIPFSDMHAGGMVFECNQHNGSLQIRLLSDPVRTDKGWTFKALSGRGEVEYLIDPDSQHLLGSYFYDRPLYEPVKLLTDII